MKPTIVYRPKAKPQGKPVAAKSAPRVISVQPTAKKPLEDAVEALARIRASRAQTMRKWRAKQRAKK